MSTRRGRTFPITLELDEAAVAKHLSKPELAAPMETLIATYRQLPAFEKAALETALRATAEQHGLKAGALIHATRVAVTGRAVSPGLFEVLELLGRERSLARLTAALSILRRAVAVMTFPPAIPSLSL